MHYTTISLILLLIKKQVLHFYLFWQGYRPSILKKIYFNDRGQYNKHALLIFECCK